MSAIDAEAGVLRPEPVEVLVVGAGPVGAGFALALAQRGVDVQVVDPAADVQFDGRARSLSARTMEHLRAWGVAEAFHEASPIPASWFGPTSFRTSMMGRELWRAPHHAPAGRLSAERAHRLPQNRATKLLREAAATAGAHLAYGWAAVGFRQDEHAAHVEVTTADGRREVLAARYVVAADGSRSTVRRAAGIERDSTPMQGYQYSVIVEVPGVFEAAGTAPNAFNWIFNDTLSDAFNPFEPDRYGMSIGPFPEPVEITEEIVAAEVARRVGTPLPHRTVSITSYRMQKRIARTFRRGRLLVAGDAAHAFPPSLGMNLNTGIADAGNGAWKVAAVLQGWGGEELLDSYDAERRLAAHRIGDATLQARAALDERIAYLRGRTIPEGDDENAVREREETIRVLRQIQPPFTGSDGAALDHRYDHSPVVVPDGTETAPWDAGTYTPIWRPGHRVPHHDLDDGTGLHAQLGPGFNLLTRSEQADPELDAAALRLLAAAQRRGVPISHADLTGRIAVGAGPRHRLSLVRPDQTLAWHGEQLPADADALLLTVTGSAPRAPGAPAAAAVVGRPPANA